MEATATLLLVISTLLIGVIIRWAVKRHNSHQFFKRHGIPGPEPSFLSGNFFQLKELKTPNDVITRWIKKYGNVFGYYLGEVPYMVVNDIEILKQVLIKDSQLFTNRPEMFVDVPPLDKTVVSAKSKRWKEMRAILSPTFSSGKMKLMAHIFKKKVDITLEVVGRRADSKEMFDAYPVFQALTLDVIADCALAMKTRCQDNPKDFLLTAVRDFIQTQDNPAAQTALMFPFVEGVMRFVATFLTAGRMTDFLIKNLRHVVKDRILNPASKSVDLLQLMLDSREKDSELSETGAKVPKLTEEEVVANAYVFLLAGYETTSTALAFTFHLLATHPDVQERLYRDIEEAADDSYGTVQGIRYLDQVFNESLRLYPPITGFISRTCDQDYPAGNFTIPKGAKVLSPVWDIHHDPDLWPDPYKFDPDRWSPENKAGIKNMSFQAFGAGPRNCIGSRFAQLEAKQAIFSLLKQFRFEVCEKTDHPISLQCPTVITQPAKGVWVRAVRRQGGASAELRGTRVEKSVGI